jgi:Lipoprotein LpqB beta-propeller domain/Sporulation and spore germination
VARLAIRRGWFPAALASVAALSAALAGCATAPSGGPPRAAPGGSNQVKAYVQPLPPPGPTSKWKPDQVVLGFLHASASYAFDPSAARQFLVPELRRSWHPGRAVAVVGAPNVTSPPNNLKQQNLGGQALPQRVVHLTGPQVATLSQSGQYQYAPGNLNIQFLLEQTSKGVWLIEQLPQQTLMLTESDFEEVYLPRNLFFFARAPGSQSPSVLVPDPVYAPLQSSSSALNTDLATGLVNGLIKGQGGWLSGATYSAFPRGTRLLKQVTITGKTAQVDLGGGAARASQSAIQQMADQLLATLGDGAYSQPLASNLQLYINNRPQIVYRAGDLVPTVPSGPVELITGTGTSVGELPQLERGAKLQGGKLQPRLSQDQIGPVTVSAVAASPSQDRPQQIAVAVEQKAGGCAIEEQPGGQGAYRSYPLTGSVGKCTSLSYDANGNVWAVADSRVWVLSPGHSPAMTPAIQPGYRVLALQMAPDAVRAALLVSTPADGIRLLLAAVNVRSGTAVFGQPVTVGTTGLTDPSGISWYDAYHLAVLASGGIYEIPLTGGAGQRPAPQLISTLPTNAQTQTLTTDGTELVVGTSEGVYAEPAASPGSWLPFATNGWDPVYPG